MFTSILAQILLATTAISGLALISALGLSLFPQFLKKTTLYLVALAAGTMLATGLFELLPESAHLLGLEMSLWIVAGTFAALLGAEKILNWHHCHDGDCENRPMGYLNLFGDGIHNFLDGIVIAAAFQVNPAVGTATTIAVALHELPQEIGDFGVLLHAGFTRWQAVIANLGVAILAVLGGFVGFTLTQNNFAIAPYLLPVAAGTFLYLAAVDLIPEFRHEENRLKSILLFGCFLIGLVALPVASAQLGLTHSHEESGAHTHDIHENDEEHMHTDEHAEEHTDDHAHEDDLDHDHEPASFHQDEL